MMIDGMNTLMGARTSAHRQDGGDFVTPVTGAGAGGITLAVRHRVLEEDDIREGAETLVELMACLPKI